MRRSLLFILLTQAIVSFSQDVSYDKKLGAEGFLSVEQQIGIYHHDSLYRLINRVGQKLVSRLKRNPFEFRFFLADSPEPNAFALPGGYVFVTRGILPLVQTEDQLAGVIAHEIIHVTERHSIKQMKKGILPTILKVPGNIISAVTGRQLGSLLNGPINLSQKAFLSQYSQKHEREADEFGIQLAASAGYQAVALAEALQILSKEIQVLTGEGEKQNYFSDHPYTPARVSDIMKMGPRFAPINPSPISASQEHFVKTFEGLIFGPNPEQGIFKDSLFIHPGLRLSWLVPSGWLTQNQPSAVAAFREDGQGVVAMRLSDTSKSVGELGKEISEKLREEYGASKSISIVYLGDTILNSFPSYMIRIVTRERSDAVAMEMVLTSYGEMIFQFSGVSALQYGNEMSASLASFRKCTQEELRSINIYRISIASAEQGETITDLSTRTNNQLSGPMTTLINDVQPEDVLNQGRLIKIIQESPYALIKKY